MTALALTDGMPTEIRELVERVAETYRVAAVPQGLLQAEAELHGTPLPEEHRPKELDPQDLYSLYAQQIQRLLAAPAGNLYTPSSHVGHSSHHSLPFWKTS